MTQQVIQRTGLCSSRPCRERPAAVPHPCALSAPWLVSQMPARCRARDHARSRSSAATEAELLCQRAVAELDRDLATLDTPFVVLLHVAVRVAGDAEDRGTDIPLLH